MPTWSTKWTMLFATLISDNSLAWFGQNITYDQLERMYRPTLQGGRNPRQMLKAATFKAFDNETKPIETFPSSGSGIFIIKLDGVKFEEKVCEAQWSVIQAEGMFTTCSTRSIHFTYVCLDHFGKKTSSLV